ncbi:reverse transcriptase domain-containing protein [Tanacetum coccineum]
MKAFKMMKELFGGFDEVGATSVDCKNFRRGINLFIGEYDVEMVVELLMNKQEYINGFSCDYFTNDDGNLSGLFWADEVAKHNYLSFGDVISFDATFRSNKYKIVFVPFTGIDNHHRCVTLAAALLSNETAEYNEDRCRKGVLQFKTSILLPTRGLPVTFPRPPLHMDEVAKHNYLSFGDVISFDATFRSNKYKIVFVPFTGIDNHHRSVTLAAALLSNETAESYGWLLRAFKKAFSREPMVMVTDQDPAMKIAVEKEFCNSRHRFCMWHIMEKLSTKASYPRLNRDLSPATLAYVPCGSCAQEQDCSILFGLPGSRQQKFLVLKFFDVKEQQGIDRVIESYKWYQSQDCSIMFGLPGSRQQKFLVLKFFDVKEQQGKDEGFAGTARINCLVKEQKKEYQTGWKIKTGNVLDSCNQRSTQQCTKSGVAKHLGVAVIQQQNGLVKETNVTLLAKYEFNAVLQGDDFEVGNHRTGVHLRGGNLMGMSNSSLVTGIACEVISKWKARLKDDMDARSDVYVLSNGCRKFIDDSDGYYWESTPGECAMEKNGKWSCIYAVGNQEYQIVCTRLDIASADVAAYMTLIGAWKKEIWLKGLLAESGYELSLVAGIATGALVKGGSRFEVPAQDEEGEKFEATNNEAEYETLIAGLRIAEKIGFQSLQVNVNSKLVANQVNGTYIAKETDMIKYLEKVKTLASTFRAFSIKEVPRSKNKKADALSKITSTSFAHLSKQVLVEELKEKSVNQSEVLTVVEE